ncbi:MAG: argininosuccinate lyase [Acidobacteriia bacterium]|nr:argininosuccinate lyase [Terriglobia bacterium]
MKMWSGRFRGGPDPEFDAWQRSFPFDRRLLPQEIAASKAHAAALHMAGVLSKSEFDATVRGLDQIEREGVASDDPAIEDVHHFVESRLVAVAGDVGYKLHTGRSRNEQIATDLRLYVRGQIDGLRGLLADLIGVLIERAQQAGDAAMPSYTHLQRAEPVLVSHWLLSYAEMFFRDMDRLADARARLNECPLGSGAIAGAILPLDRRSMATKLGFDRPTANSMDATSDRDFAIEFAQSLSLLAVHLSRWAEEMILFSTTEYGFITLPEAYSTGSSAMPQKKNPDSCELIRGKAGRVIANATALLIAAKGLPLAYNKDLQETQQPVFDSAEQCAAMMKIAAGFMFTVTFNFDRMRAAASTGCMNAMAAAGHLVKNGVPFRRAHELVGAAVQLALQNGCELQDLSPQQWKQCGVDSTGELRASLSLDAVLACHDVEGGTAPRRVQQALAHAQERLAASKGAAHVGA